ncbi:unnamed protein product [[Actinomadura] parvosata subsp. kistnae]|nr:unnamed protein product [Actinomadura parvosata subsp. kistnae]
MNYIFLSLFDCLFPYPRQRRRAIRDTTPTPLRTDPTTGARDGLSETLTPACA